ncbi:MAG: PAS domain-containing protein, partial [Tardiphaga sp.]
MSSPFDTSHELKLTWDITPDLLGVINRAGVMERSNPAWETETGWGAAELRGQSVLGLIHPEDRQRAAAILATLSDGQPAMRFENRFRHKDGSWRMLSWTAAPYAEAIYCVARDITSDRAREAALQDSMDFTRLALSSVNGVGVWTYDVASDRFFCDAAICDLYGLGHVGPEGILRSGFLANVHPDDVPSLRATMSGGLNQSGDLELEYRIKHPDGSVRWVLSRGHTYHDADGTPVRRTGVGIETTRQRQLEEQLRQSQKMEAIGQLTGGVAHDFNNLLTVIRSSADLLKRPDLPEERRLRYVEAIAGTVDRAAKLTAQLLAFSRRQALKPDVFDAGQAIELILDMLHTLTGSRVQVALRLPAQPCYVCADRNQFENAIVNLTANARDAMDGDGEITIAAQAVAAIPAHRGHPAAVVGDFLALSLTDSGSGIRAADLDKIFEPFFTTKDVGHGTGLGLSQVIGFAKQSGGDVMVKSEVGVGTTFTLYLPRVADGLQAQPQTAPEFAADGNDIRVLLVEDNAEIGQFASQALAELGYRTLLVADAPTALAELAAGSDRFDVVFSDVVMPGMNGIELGQQIVQLYPDLPVVLTSGYSHALAQTGSAGFELLHKPYSVE